MSGVSITRRVSPSGKVRYEVRYRRGGRGWPVEHAGSFRTVREARLRRDLVAGELAAGRDPQLVLAPPVERSRRSLREWAAAYERSRRVDFAAETRKNLGSHLKRILPAFGEREPETIAWSEVQEWVAELADGLKPASVSRYFSTLRLLLDFAGVDPNPARDPRVKLPPIVAVEPQPPTARELLALLERCPRRWVLPLVVIEQTALRVGEAQSLAWGDVDVAGGQFRLRGGETKTRRARWVQVPAWLMDELSLSCPPDDRTAERRVFPGFSADVAKNVMARACRAAGIAHFHPHDLRHRRTSLWHGQGVPAKELAARVGHARASLTLDVYSHVMPLDEAAPERLRQLLAR